MGRDGETRKEEKVGSTLSSCIPSVSDQGRGKEA